MKYYHVVSDNFDDYLTEDAYKLLCLEMSTGDFHTHTAKEVKLEDIPKGKNIITEEDF